jgi:hypothetical protein
MPEDRLELNLLAEHELHYLMCLQADYRHLWGYTRQYGATEADHRQAAAALQRYREVEARFGVRPLPLASLRAAAFLGVRLRMVAADERLRKALE